LNRAVLLRKNAQGYVTNKLRVGKIERGQEPDLELQADDIVFVPNNRLKNMISDTESVATSIGSASIYAVVH